MNSNSEDAIMPRNKRKKPLVTSMVLLLVILGGSYYYFTKQDETPENAARISVVEIGSIENTIAAAGSLQPSEYVDVGAQVSGQLQQLYVEIGDIVEEGQLLAEIDARVQAARVEAGRASIEALEAQIAAREASLKLARANAERQARLKSLDATSQLDYDNAMNALASAESSLIQLQKQIQQNVATLETSETELGFTSIYAPMAGTVVSVFLEEGRTLNATQQAPTILRIADLGTMTVEADISEADISDIRAGMNVYFTTLGGGDRRWYSEVRQVLPTPKVESNVVLYTGLFDIDNSDSALLPEMTAQVYFVTASAQDVLTIPMGAVTFVERPVGTPAANSDEAVTADDARSAARPARVGQGQSARRELPAGEGNSRTGLQRPARQPAQVAEGKNRDSELRPALVSIIDDAGVQTTQRILVGVSSRITAEIVDGLSEGDRVVSGVIQLQRPSREEGTNNGPPGGFGGGRPR